MLKIVRGVCRINFGEVWTSEKIGGEGVTPRKLITFYPFVDSIMVILVNCLAFVTFFPSFVSIFFRLTFFCTPAYVPEYSSGFP